MTKVACIIPDKPALQRNTVGKMKWNIFVLKAPLTSINVSHNTRGKRNVLCTGTEVIARQEYSQTGQFCCNQIYSSGQDTKNKIQDKALILLLSLYLHRCKIQFP
jgi:hypothetical protein